MSISCPSLSLTLFEDLIKIDNKVEDGFKKIQNEIGTMSVKLKDNSKELEIIHKLFLSLNERVNNSTKKENNSEILFRDTYIDSRFDFLNKKIETIETSFKNEIEKSKKEIKEFIEDKTEEIHSRLLKNLAFIYEQQLKAIRNELSRPIPPVSPVIIPIQTNQTKPNMVLEEEQWTKVDKKNYKPK